MSLALLFAIFAVFEVAQAGFLSSVSRQVLGQGGQLEAAGQVQVNAKKNRPSSPVQKRCNSVTRQDLTKSKGTM